MIILRRITSEELAKVPGMGPDKAWNIIQQRPVMFFRPRMRLELRPLSALA